MNEELETVATANTIEILLDCIEKLMAVLRDTVEAERAEAIYEEFFGK